MAKIIGITGPSGSGKTELCRRICTSSVAYINADDLYHSMLSPDSDVLCAITEAFGNHILTSSCELDRAALAQIVFADEKALALLNATVLPFVIAETRKYIAELERAGYSAIIIDAPTLIESGFVDECDAVIVVLATPELRTLRVSARDAISAEAARKRILAQKSDDFYTSVADLVIINNGDPERLSEAADKVIDLIEHI